MIYLDNAASSPIYHEIIEDYWEALENYYGNPSSLHRAGKDAMKVVEHEREAIAKYIGAKPSEIVFTSGGSESDNLALRGIVPYLKEIKKTTIITSKIEHHAVLHTCADLEKQGMQVLYLSVHSDGRIDIEELDELLKEHHDTVGLVSIMAVNNEIGTIQLLDDIGELCKEYDVLFMTDAVQAFGHIPIDVDRSRIDLMAVSGHKINTPKGIGFLYVREGVRLVSEITGGSQEKNLRAGTENVPGIVALGERVKCLTVNDPLEPHYRKCRAAFLDALKESDLEYYINCDNGVPNIISLTIPHCESEAMLLLLNENGIYVSARSACTAGMLEPSHVLKAIGLSDNDASCTIRISMGYQNTVYDLERCADVIIYSAKKLKEMM